MSFFTNLRADRLITEIRATSEPSDATRQKAIARLKEMGPGAIEAIFAALPDADKASTMAFVDVLASLVNPKTFPLFLRGAGAGQSAGNLRHLLGAYQQPELPREHAARGARYPRGRRSPRCSR